MNQSTPNTIAPSMADFQQLLNVNPLAAAQLEAIVWKRIGIAEMEARASLELEIAEFTEAAEAPPVDIGNGQA